MGDKYHWGGTHKLDNPYGKLRIDRVRLDRGGYTSSGRYFGGGPPLYNVMTDDSADGEVDFYIRAADRKAAIAEVRGMYPQAKIPGGGGGASKAKRTRPARSSSKRSKPSRSSGPKRRILSRLRRVRIGVGRRGFGVTRPSHVPSSVGMEKARMLAASLRALGHEAEAFVQYGNRPTVGCDRLKFTSTAGTWMRLISFTPSGSLVKFAGGSRGNPWRSGPEHDAVEAVADA